MINLLPYEQKTELKAAHCNSNLIKYVTFLLFAFGFLVLLCLGAYIVLTTIKITNENAIANQTQSQALSPTLQASLDEANSSLESASAILNSEKSYTGLLDSISNIIPNESEIDNISASNSSNQITIALRTKSSVTSADVQELFSSNGTFYSYRLVSNTTDSSDIDGYTNIINFTVSVNWEAL